MWIEDERVIGLWTPENDPDDQYIISLNYDYRADSASLREDATFIHSRPAGTPYYIYTGHIMELRGENIRYIDTGQQEMFE